MKKLSRILSLLLAGIMVFSLTACGGGGNPDTPPGYSGPAPSGTTGGDGGSGSAAKDSIKIAISRNVTALDGFTGNNVSYGLAYEIFDTLTVLNPDSTLRPGIAESWEQVDDYTWRFNLRQGVKFTNGEELTAESAAYSVNYMAGLDVNYQNYKQWGQSWPPAAEVESDTAILIKTPKPNLAIPSLMTRCAMLPMEASQDEEFFKAPIGSGAYKLVSWEVGVQVVLEANEEYWGGAPAIKTLTYDIMSDGTARASAIKSGEYDFVENVPFDTAMDMLSNPADGIELVQTPLTGMWYVYYNGYSTNKFITNPEFRKALWYAIDSKGIVDALLGGLPGSPKGLAPMTLVGAYDGGGYPARDVEKAKQIAADLGYNGEEIRIAYSGTQFNNDVEILEFIMSQLLEAGFNVTYTEYDNATWSSQYKSTDAYDICTNGYGGTYTGDTEMYYTQGCRNLGWTYDAAETIMNDIYSEGITPEVRTQKLSELMQICWDEAPYLWGAEGVGLWGINPNLQGYEILPHGQVNFISASFK